MIDSFYINFDNLKELNFKLSKFNLSKYYKTGPKKQKYRKLYL